MLVRAAEESFAKAMEALHEGRRLEALALFEAAISLERQLGAARAEPRYLSYYGLCLALETQRASEAVELCREAVSAEFYNPDLHCNLGRVLLASRRKREAYQAFKNGLKWERSHPGIQRELRAMGTRRRPVLSFLARAHPLNVLLGQMLNGTRSRKPGRT